MRAGQPLLTLHTDTPERFDRALAALDDALTVVEAPSGERTDVRPPDVILDRIPS